MSLSFFKEKALHYFLYGFRPETTITVPSLQFIHMYCKVTIKVFTPLREEFEARLQELHTKRDWFLDHLIGCELPYLEADLRGKKLSTSMRRYISRSLKRMGTSQINVSLRGSTARKLNEIVRQTNIVRDSFINRLMYFSLAREPLLRYIGVPLLDGNKSIENIPIGYLDAMRFVQTDPLARLRRAEGLEDIGLYGIALPDALAAFACYLENEPQSSMHIAGLRASRTNSSHQLNIFEDSIFKASGLPNG